MDTIFFSLPQNKYFTPSSRDFMVPLRSAAALLPPTFPAIRYDCKNCKKRSVVHIQVGVNSTALGFSVKDSMTDGSYFNIS